MDHSAPETRGRQKSKVAAKSLYAVFTAIASHFRGRFFQKLAHVVYSSGKIHIDFFHADRLLSAHFALSAQHVQKISSSRASAASGIPTMSYPTRPKR